MDFDIRKHSIILTLAGSRCYGIHTAESDIDARGVAIPPKKYYLGYLDKFEQADSVAELAKFIDCFSQEEKDIITATKLEGSIYDLRKFAKLAADANPNILDVLFCRDEDVRYITKAGQLLRDNRDLFISSKAKYTFTGYAVSQLKRIMTHRKWLLNPPKAPPERKDFGLGEEAIIPRDQFLVAQDAINKRLDGWEIDFGELSEAEVIYIQSQIGNYLTEIMCSTEEKWKHAARLIGMDDNLIFALEKERKYLHAKQHWGQYNDWVKGRNAGRAELEAKFGYDTKHAAHLYRLLVMCKEIMTDGKVNVYRGDIDREQILDIRRGAWDFDKLIAWAEKQQKELDDLYLARKFSVPKEPQRLKINALVIELIENALSAS